MKRKALQYFAGRRGTLSVLGATLAAMLACGPAAGTEFLIEVTGLPALKFRGECEVVSDAGVAERAEFSGLIPASYIVKAAAVSCKIQKWDAFGRLKAKLRLDDELIAKAETRAAFNWVRVRSAGPWGEAAGIRGITTLKFSNPPRSRPQSVPRFSPNAVPRLRPAP